MTYEVVGAPELHPPEFVGVATPVPHWVLKDQGGGVPSYNCTEYTIRRLLRQYPRLSPSPLLPDYGPPENYQVETSAAESILLDLGFSSTTLGPGHALPRGCICSYPDDDAMKGKSSSLPVESQDSKPKCILPATECAALFFPVDREPRHRDADHAIVYDNQYCDWGGKMRPTVPIMRFRTPVDYITIVEGSAANIGKYDIVVFCRPSLTPLLGPMMSDRKFNKGAKTPNPDGSMPD